MHNIPAAPMFLPTCLAEMHAWGWERIDIIIVTGDSYIDSPYIGAAVIGRVLCAAGYRVGIIAQPAPRSPRSDYPLLRAGRLSSCRTFTTTATGSSNNSALRAARLR